MAKQDVRLQVFVTEDMDDRLTDMSELMGMRKNEIVRMAIAQFCASWNTAVNMARDLAMDGLMEEIKRKSTPNSSGVGSGCDAPDGQTLLDDYLKTLKSKG